ncbi:DUF1615 domain-containing protein [Thauera sinica]|uniref:DUF1615 domain-containing protein n=1 Tax=Thauera sinica TaxID=2665146 RepID=A0ABW1AV79_9RHOO|nr:DUF1615 domain-containing protein [Thauera sp. K11]ATE61153.1 hypothetical protein CCZ27_15490 [Thauera sp. K11]
MKPRSSRLRLPVSGILLATLLAACATPEPPRTQPPAPVESRMPGSVRPPATAPAAAPVPLPAPSPAAPGGVLQPLPAPGLPPAAPAPFTGPQGQALVQQLLPPVVTKDRAGWAADIAAAFTALGLPPSAENYCAAIAVIEQESTFQADPAVPGLSKIVWREIEARRAKYLIPRVALDTALARPSPGGRSYRQRIDALRTEREMSELFGDMIDELPAGKLLLSGYNPVRTGGPMQVSVAFAEEHARARPYPLPARATLRDAVFTRRGGLYFGIAHLLDYPAPYRDPLYRFADFNAGHYSSRNAAFQQAVARLSGRTLALDGDLLNYAGGTPAATASNTQRAVLGLSRRLGLSREEIQAGLRQEKDESFYRTQVYRRVFALADAAAGRPLPREAVPRIDLKSPKIRSRITTGWFAERVKMRYGHCMDRAALARSL